jgi:hypothetical protein
MMIDIDALTEEAKANEPKVIYDSYKACNGQETSWHTVTLNGGGSAQAVVTGKTITLTYADGSVATYTEQS